VLKAALLAFEAQHVELLAHQELCAVADWTGFSHNLWFFFLHAISPFLFASVHSLGSPQRLGLYARSLSSASGISSSSFFTAFIFLSKACMRSSFALLTKSFLGKPWFASRKRFLLACARQYARFSSIGMSLIFLPALGLRLACTFANCLGGPISGETSIGVSSVGL
jgi:hypothetical protein